MKPQQTAAHIAEYNAAHRPADRPLAQRVTILRCATDQALRMSDDWREKTRAEGAQLLATLRTQYTQLLAELLEQTQPDEKLTAKMVEVAELLEVQP